MIFQTSFAVSNLFNALQQYGFVDLVLPFILIFGVVFALLQQIKIFGDGDAGKKYNTIIALAISLLITVPHALNPRADDAISIIQRFLPEFVFLALALLLVIMLLGMVVATPQTKGLITGILGVLAVGYLVLTILGAVTRISLPFTFLWDPNFLSIIIIILNFGGVVYYVAGPDTSCKKWTDTIESWVKALLGR